MILRLNLRQFVTQVAHNCLSAIESAPFSSEQVELLRATVERFFKAAPADDWGQPLGLFYAVYRAFGAEEDALALELGRFAAFYVVSADLFDDVQDDDLAGTPHEAAGAAIATNSALSLLTLALDALGEATRSEEREERRLRYLRLFNRVSLIAVGAQHLDLMGHKGAQSRLEVERMHRGKTSSIALITECAAWAGGATESEALRFYEVGEELAAAVQIVDDVRDLVAKERSVDLESGKSTYPLACFNESATSLEKAQLQHLLAQSTIDLASVCELLETQGSFHQCAAAVEGHRQRIFALLGQEAPASLPPPPKVTVLVPFQGKSSTEAGPHRRLIAEMVDQLATVLYDPPPRVLDGHPPSGIFAVQAQLDAQAFFSVAREWGMKRIPELRLWHFPIFLYERQLQAIYLSDLDGLAEEVLPFHQQLLGASAQDTASSMQRTLPFVMAHEMTHALRDQLDRLGDDAWLEEYIANELAFAYVREHRPGVAEAVLHSCRQIVERIPAEVEKDSRCDLFEQWSQGCGKGGDYESSPEEAALLHAQMVLFIAGQKRPLEAVVGKWFSPGLAIAAQ